MIPFYKLEKLPRTQKLRKIAKILAMAENRLCMSGNAEIFTSAELVFFTEASVYLSADELFSPEAKKVFAEAAEVFRQGDSIRLRRVINNVKHILLTETGSEQAEWDFICGNGQLDAQKRQIAEGMFVYLEDIRSPFNVGAMFRTAESFGTEKIILSPFCADPYHKRAERTAMGCIDIVSWERKELFAASSDAKSSYNFNGLPVFALETGGFPIDKFPFPRRGLLIAGSEELGVSPQALEAADASLGRVSIPCYGTKASLNVSVAFGIALQIWREKINQY